MRKLKIEELNRLSVQEYQSSEKNPLVLVLDNVRSMNNVGSAFRTADAFRVDKICLCGITARPPHREINKTALGATESVEWTYHEYTMNAIHELKEKGYKIISVEQAEGSTNLQDLKIETTEKFALVFGNEVFGVEQEVIDASDLCVEIPQFGTKHSLNISVSMGIVVWDLVKRWL